MDNNDKLYNCAKLYSQLSNYEYNLTLFDKGEIINTKIDFDIPSFLHLSGLEKLKDLPLIEKNPNSKVIHRFIMDGTLTYKYACSSSKWNAPLNNPQKNNVTYTLEDRINMLTNLHDILSSNSIKAYSWKSKCHRSLRPYNSEISADLMLVLDNSDKKTPDERLYIFLKADRHDSKILHGVSQFPTDQTYNNDGRISVPEIKIISLIEHDKIRDSDRNIIDISADERSTLIKHSLNNAQFNTIKGDVKHLRSLRQDFTKTHSESSKRKYENKINYIVNNKIYTIEMLENVIDKLTAQEQDHNNSKVKPLIHKEIELIKQGIIAREREDKGSLSTTNITLSVNKHNGNDLMTIEPIISIEVPKTLTKAKTKSEQTVHLIGVTISNTFSNIKSAFKKFIAKSDKEPQKKSSAKHHAVKPKPPKAVRTVKPDIPKAVREQENEPLFSVSKIKSDKYSPTSSKDKTIDRTKKNDLDL